MRFQKKSYGGSRFLCKELGSLSKQHGHGMENISSKSNFQVHSLKYFTFHSLKYFTFMLFNMDEVIRGYKQAEGGILPK